MNIDTNTFTKQKFNVIAMEEDNKDNIEQNCEEVIEESVHKSIYTKVTSPEVSLSTIKNFKIGCSGDACIENCLPNTVKLLVPLDGKIWKSISARTFHSKNEHLDEPLKLRTASARCNVDPLQIFDHYFQASVLINGLIHVQCEDNYMK